jgi:transposase
LLIKKNLEQSFVQQPDRHSLSYALSENKRQEMSESKRKIFTGAQKAKIALEAVKGVKTINEIAQEHSVHPTQVSQWKKELLANAGSLFEGKRGPKPVNAQSDPDRLYAKIGQLNMELDWLKKKSGISL